MKLLILALFACIVSVYCGGYSHDNHYDMYHDHGHGYSHHGYGNTYHIIEKVYRPHQYHHLRLHHYGPSHISGYPAPQQVEQSYSPPMESSQSYSVPQEQSYSSPIESSQSYTAPSASSSY